MDLHLALLLLLLLLPPTTPSLPAARACHPADLRALRVFSSSLSSGSSALAWEGVSCCEWEGVSCSGNATAPRVVSLRLSARGLSGSLPASLRHLAVLDLSRNRFSGSIDALGGLPTLTTLNLSDNAFSGELPSSLFALRNLAVLSLSGNQFSGPVPGGIVNLTDLRTLDLASNRFSGVLPDVFARLPRLEQLLAHSNSFSGSLPRSLSRCSALRELDLRNNSLSGNLDLDFASLAALQSLDLASNHLTGPLPAGLSACSRLRTLSLARNRFSGELPAGFGDLSSLTFLSLSNNSLVNFSVALRVLQRCRNLTTLVLAMNFYGEEIPGSVDGYENLSVFATGNCGLTGQLPQWLRSFRRLEVLDLSWNRLNGVVPSWIGEFQNLFYLDISNNSFTGEIPRSLTCLRVLVSLDNLPQPSQIDVPLYVKRNQSTTGRQYIQLSGIPPSLYLNDNELIGTIWPEFGRLRQLHVLDLSNNHISGVIPETIAQMENLEVLDLSFNQLHGRIPESLNKLTFLSKFSVAYNHLEGEIPKGGQFFSFSNSSYEGNSRLRSGSQASSFHQEPSTAASPQSLPVRGRNGRKGSILGITISIGVGISALFTVVLLNMSRKEMEEPLFSGYLQDRSDRIHDLRESRSIHLYHNSDCKELTVMDILKSTNNFDQANIIGCGGFGLVYKAIFFDGTKAAIKRMSGDCGQVEREFQAEIEALANVQHDNLVLLKGYCKHAGDRLLIYSYMENGSLDYWLHEREDGGSKLKWASRLRIAQGAARGLAYLHNICEPSIVHRDIKSSNILLDERFEAHLADFGLSRFIQPCNTHVTTDLVGTLGYIPPEYSQTLIATMKGDVFSFGVVLLELLTGRRPVDICKVKGSQDLVSWARQMKLEKKEELIFDSLIWTEAHERQLLAVLEIACRCISIDPRLRPSSDQVASWLDNLDSS